MANKHNSLDELFTATADAIREKTGGTEKIIADNFPEAITNIQVGIDTSDGTAVSTDIAKDKVAYVNGERIVGGLDNRTAGSTISVGFQRIVNNANNNTSAQIYSNFLSDTIMRANSTTSVSVPYENFGDATAEDVISGKTFTSSAGLKITGTASAGAKFATGTYKNNNLSSTPQSFTISLEFKPKFIWVYSENVSSSGVIIIIANIENSSGYFYLSSGTRQNAVFNSNSGTTNYRINVYDDNSVKFTYLSGFSYSMGTYYWYAIG